MLQRIADSIDRFLTINGGILSLFLSS